MQNFFPAGHEVLVNAKQVEKQVGPLGSIELLLHFKNPDRLNNRLKVQGMNALCAKILEQTEIESCLSAATFAPTLTRRPSAIQKTAENSRLDVLRQAMLDVGMLHVSQT